MPRDLQRTMGRTTALGALIWAAQHIPLSPGQAGIFGFFLIAGLIFSGDV